MAKKLFRPGVDSVLEEGETVEYITVWDGNTYYGPTKVTAAWVAAEGHIGRAVLDSIEPPERLQQLDRESILGLARLAAHRGVQVIND